MQTISVIIPVYNVADYLRQCLDSVLNQTYSQLEIILVNDGSTDDSAAICTEYAKKDNRVRLFHQENAGLSAARNTGIVHVTGDYLTFIDSDDWVEVDYIERLYVNIQDYQAAVSIVSFYRYYEENKEFVWYTMRGKKEPDIFTPEEAMNHYYDIDANRTTNFIVAWGKLFKASLFDTVRFPVGKYCEDDFTTYKLLLLADRIVMDYDPLYCYRERSGSLTQINFTLQRLQDYREAHEERMTYMAACGYDLAPHLQVYYNKMTFIRDRLLEIGEVTEYERYCREINLWESHWRKGS